MDVVIIGASGYTGVELVRLLAPHPHVRIVAGTSEQSAGQRLDHVFPGLLGLPAGEIILEAIGKPSGNSWPALDRLLERAKFFFTALPHGTSTPCVAYLINKGARVADLSADFRLKDLATYETWYGKHEAGNLITDAVYGLPELHRIELGKTRLAAVPGCYPTSANLALAPAVKSGLIDLSTIIVDSKSGVSGAGRGLKTSSLFSEVHGGMRAYGVAGHRHTPEIEQELSNVAGQPITVTFTPHLVPMSRGILTVAYAKLRKSMTLAEMEAVYESHYSKEPFVRFRKSPGALPDTNFVLGTYYCDVAVRLDERTQRVIAISAIDNLCRGASGMAVASMNLMNGWPEGTALPLAPLVP